MAGSVNIFNTGKSALFTSRSALTTTGHNIANVNTEGYTRQRVNQEAGEVQKLGRSVYGSGVKVSGIDRINDEYLTKQVANEAKFMGQYEEKEAALAQVDTIFNEMNNEGLNRLMARFFNEFRKLGNDPESEAMRATVKESANQLVGDVHRIQRSLQDVLKNIDNRIDSNVRTANELIDRITHLNKEVKQIEINGGSANDLKDKRDLAIKKLSEIADISVSSNERGEMSINLAGIGPLVSGELKNKLYTETAPADPKMGRQDGGLVIRIERNNDPDVSSRLHNGKLGGLIESRGRIVGQAMARLDELSYTLAKSVNEVHRFGFNLNGTNGVNFFQEPVSKTGASANLSLSSDVLSDHNNIATALSPNSPGDNRVTQLISKLQHTRMMHDGRSTFDDHYNATVADLATIAQKNKQVIEHQRHVVDQLEKMRQSISGVSIDEETMNLVQYQQAFNASAKVIQVADEMLDTIMNIKR